MPNPWDPQKKKDEEKADPNQPVDLSPRGAPLLDAALEAQMGPPGKNFVKPTRSSREMQKSLGPRWNKE